MKEDTITTGFRICPKCGKHYHGTLALSREDNEALFTKTKERVTFTFNGWDGESYDGESRTGCIYRAAIKGYEEVRFIKVGKGLHYIDEDSSVIEIATGEAHKEAEMAGGCGKSLRKTKTSENGSPSA